MGGTAETVTTHMGVQISEPKNDQWGIRTSARRELPMYRLDLYLETAIALTHREYLGGKMKSSRYVALGAILILLAGCDLRPDGTDDGKPLAVSDAHMAVAAVTKEAKKRGLKNSLSKPFRVFLGDEAKVEKPLFTVSWADADTSDIDWHQVNDDVLVDRMSLSISSAEGMLPFYAYCFGDQGHAQTATRFCTKTLISAMTAASPSKK